MAKKAPTKKLIPVLNQCGDCSHGTFLDYQSNYDHKGDPLCLKCPFNEFNRLRVDKACSNFKKKI